MVWDKEWPWMCCRLPVTWLAASRQWAISGKAMPCDCGTSVWSSLFFLPDRLLMLQPTAELHSTRANDDSARHFDLLRDQAAADLSRDEVVALESALPAACCLGGIDSRIRLNFFVHLSKTS
ncbi:unnamed protein product [Cercospora beticola]|nr:unnamed protein product [Cercospora beticola]